MSVDDAYHESQQVMGWASRRLGKLLPGLPKDLRFRRYFGVSAEVAVQVWDMMGEHNCLPHDPEFLNFLWALAPANDKALSTLLGGSDPKTIRKYIWPFINSIFKLDGVVVSLLL